MQQIEYDEFGRVANDSNEAAAGIGIEGSGIIILAPLGVAFDTGVGFGTGLGMTGTKVFGFNPFSSDKNDACNNGTLL